jgi:hypothetical protein
MKWMKARQAFFDRLFHEPKMVAEGILVGQVHGFQVGSGL